MDLMQLTDMTVTLALLGAVVTFFFRFQKPAPEPPKEPQETAPSQPELERRVTDLEFKFHRLVEEVHERAEASNQIWRRINRRDQAARARAEKELGEEEEDGGQLSLEHEAGGGSGGVFPVRQDVGGAGTPAWHQAARVLAQEALTPRF